MAAEMMMTRTRKVTRSECAMVPVGNGRMTGEEFPVHLGFWRAACYWVISSTGRATKGVSSDVSDFTYAR